MVQGVPPEGPLRPIGQPEGWASRTSGHPAAVDPVPLPRCGTALHRTAGSLLGPLEGPESGCASQEDCSEPQLWPAYRLGPSCRLPSSAASLAPPPGLLRTPAAGLCGPGGQTIPLPPWACSAGRLCSPARQGPISSSEPGKGSQGQSLQSHNLNPHLVSPGPPTPIH